MAREWVRVLVAGVDVPHRLPLYNALVGALKKEGLEDRVVVWTTADVREVTHFNGHAIERTFLARTLEEPSEENIRDFIRAMKEHPLCN